MKFAAIPLFLNKASRVQIPKTSRILSKVDDYLRNTYSKECKLKVLSKSGCYLVVQEHLKISFKNW